MSSFDMFDLAFSKHKYNDKTLQSLDMNRRNGHILKVYHKFTQTDNNILTNYSYTI